jgi:hypothetical protein
MRMEKVENKQEMEDSMLSYMRQGYSIKMRDEKSVTMVKRSYGNIGIHIVLALFTFLIGNALYAAFCYAAKSDEVFIQIV